MNLITLEELDVNFRNLKKKKKKKKKKYKFNNLYTAIKTSKHQ